MLYFFAALLLIVGILILYRMFLPVGEPSLEIVGIMTEDELKAKLVDLAYAMKANEGSSTLSYHLVIKTIERAYKRISEKPPEKMLDFEKWIYDNYYKLDELISEQKKLAVRYNKLVGYKELPRIFCIAEFIVKGSGGAVDSGLVGRCLDAFNEVLPLRYEEVELFPEALKLALLEYVAIFCGRSLVINDKFDLGIGDVKAKRIDMGNLRYNSYAYAFYKYSRGELHSRFESRCVEDGLSAAQRVDDFLLSCAKYAGAVSGAIRSIYGLSKLNDEFILDHCPLNNFLCEKKDIVYSDCTLATRRIYLKRIAKKSKGKSEMACADKIVKEALEKGKDIAHFILPRPLGKFALVVYICLIVGYTISNCVTVFMYAPQFKWLASIIFLPISLNLVLMFITSINVRIFSRRFMPRKKLDGTERALIVYTVLVFDKAELDEMIDKLKTIAFANNDKIFSYGLLIDLPASKVERTKADVELIEYARSRFLELGDRFALFLRRRTKVKGEDKFQGWEKKRGAILDLNNLIISGEKRPFEVIVGAPCDVKYVVTLDSDTLLDCAYELVEIMEHPFNSDKAVVSLNVKTAPSAIRTPFAEVMSDSVGLNNYTNFVADANYDIFGSGNYTGKGIYRVGDFTSKVKDVFMENRVLSHDFVEGAVAGCGGSGESALDSYPETFSSFLGRNIRWLRGDWQLLPFLATRIRDGNGKFRKNPVSIIGRMHILNNIILGLIPLSSTILLILAMFSSKAFFLTAAAFTLNIFMFLGALRLIFFHPKRVWYEFLRQLLMASCLPVIAYNYTKAILITIYRLIVKKDLLDWKVFAHSHGKVSFLPNLIAALAYVILAIFRFKWTFVVMAALFMSGIIYAKCLSQTRNRPKRSLTSEQESILKKIAADSWIFFEKQLKKENNFLPFDNYQVYGEVGYAKRTSPTDIAFMMISLVCAFDLGFLERSELEFYADKILLSIEAAEKWKGNLYNWMDVYSLKKLSGYVSSVDSGNLLSALILVRNVTGGSLAGRAQRLIEATDLGAFFDGEKGLLAIGYDDDAKSFDSNHYDLLGSEAMLTYLVGIGLGKIESSSFRNLSGRCVRYKGTSLYSWSGGAFEYMMPSLLFRYHDGGLLHTSAKNVMKGNIAYAKRMGAPFWGSSESQYSAFDGMGNYQYRAFGVPEISLCHERRRAVVAPYASLLFLNIDPPRVAENVRKMTECGMQGEDGLFEAFDDGVIETYMAHHQGMILASLCNYFCQNAPIEQFASPDMRAASLLITMFDVPKARRKREYSQIEEKEHFVDAKRTSPPTLNLMTNGKYSVLIDDRGCGYSYYLGRFISRYYDHDGGVKLFLSYGKGRIDLAQSARFYDGRSEFFYSDGRCSISQIAAVYPNMNGETRCIRIKNLTEKPLTLSIESYMEVALAPLYDDISHKTFSGMFVETSIDERLGAVARRKGLIAAHFFDRHAVYTCDRAKFFGRSDADFGKVLDPILSGKVEVSLAPTEEKVIRAHILVAEDIELLYRQVGLIGLDGAFDRTLSGCKQLCRGYGIGDRMRMAASRLLFPSPNLYSGELPLVCIKTNALTERIKGKIELLSRLGLFGINVHIVVIYSGDGFVKERLGEGILPLLGSNCTISLVESDKANFAEKCATDIDDMEPVELKSAGATVKSAMSNELPSIKYEYKLGKGGFLSDGSYALCHHGDLPPRPWSNVISTKGFGTIVTESGGGYVYGDNSRENKLTEWSNDPVKDPCGDGIVLFEDKIAWSVSYEPIRAEGDYQVVHGFGFTEFRCGYNDFYASLVEYVFGKTKYYELSLLSLRNEERQVEAMFFTVPVLGDFRFRTMHNLACKYDGDRLEVENLFSKSKFFVGCDKPISNYVCHKQAYVDKKGNFFAPKSDEGYEFAPAVTVRLTIPPRGSVRARFYLSADGQTTGRGGERLIDEIKRRYANLSCLSLETGNKRIDYLLKWLPYQVLTSRFLGRTGFYQAGGAIGFRDQLQDCLTMLYVDPQAVKAHILDCAAHQFEKGDVQHWWHPPRTGVRTLISDDRLFLPYITAEYIEFTGDEAILNERIPYLCDVKLMGKDRYCSPEQTVSSGTLKEHCIKAIRASAKLGENGLMLIGGGDWNDAMDKVGIMGKGTTVWGSMFLYLTIKKFLPYIKSKSTFYELQTRLGEAINKAWDGEWFTRAVCDDGRVLGSKNSPECNIDLITQSFAALCGCVNKNRVKLALYSAASRLVDRENGLIKLLTPPLKEMKVGYICDYPAGVRENGGQYTHGAIWFIMSLFAVGEADYAFELLDMISPITHSLTPERVARYEVEPYVISADVYADPPGKGGWSWYTGAASWFYYVVVRYLFGIKFTGDVITVSPSLPRSIPKASFEVRRNGISFTVTIDNSQKEGDWRLVIGGRGYNTNSIAISESIDKKELILRRSK